MIDKYIYIIYLPYLCTPTEVPQRCTRGTEVPPRHLRPTSVYRLCAKWLKTQVASVTSAISAPQFPPSGRHSDSSQFSRFKEQKMSDSERAVIDVELRYRRATERDSADE